MITLIGRKGRRKTLSSIFIVEFYSIPSNKEEGEVLEGIFLGDPRGGFSGK